MWRTVPLYCTAAAVTVEECLHDIHRGRVAAALPRLNKLKAALCTVQGVDFARALCFLFDKKSNLLAARQSLLEELRLHPQHHEAQALLHQVNDTARPLLAPPAEVRKQYPLFSLLFDALLDSTMLTWPRLLHLYQAVDRLARLDMKDSRNGDPGHVVECGTAGGGSAVLMAVVLAEAENSCGILTSPLRRVFALDSFTGMPSPTAKDCLASIPVSASSSSQLKPPRSPDEATASWGTGTCRSPATHVQQLARHFAVEDRLVVIEGLFADSIPARLLSRSDVQRDGVALLHVDADWHASTRAALELIVPVMRRRTAGDRGMGGSPYPYRIVQVDDYHYWQGCREAVDEYVAKWGAGSPHIGDIDGNAVWFAVSRDGDDVTHNTTYQ
ncbi:putative Macrocin-O-methyltransferase (TylF)/Methyltransferase domain containing protein [Leishmania utingensis]|uniref:Macrocin-O-methyltransferase (TylF)/Methyltransferase domain containing protein n=1 Tax=Leishmania utingensis TaxID=653362 RepID=A0AAW2ZTP4_9TRYP